MTRAFNSDPGVLRTSLLVVGLSSAAAAIALTATDSQTAAGPVKHAEQQADANHAANLGHAAALPAPETPSPTNEKHNAQPKKSTISSTHKPSPTAVPIVRISPKPSPTAAIFYPPKLPKRPVFTGLPTTKPYALLNLHPEKLTIPSEVASYAAQNAVYDGCSAFLIHQGGDVTKPVTGEISADHCGKLAEDGDLKLNADGSLKLDANGEAELDHKTPIVEETGDNLDSTTLVGPIKQWLIAKSNTTKPTTKDEAFGTFSDNTVQQVQSDYNQNRLTEAQIDALPQGSPVYMAGYPAAQPDNPGALRRQMFVGSYLGTETDNIGNETIKVAEIAMPIRTAAVAGGPPENGATIVDPRDAATEASGGVSGSEFFVPKKITEPDGSVVEKFESLGSTFDGDDFGGLVGTKDPAEQQSIKASAESQYGVNLDGYNNLLGVAIQEPVLGVDGVIANVVQPPVPFSDPDGALEKTLTNKFNSLTDSAQLVDGFVKLPQPDGSVVWVDRPIAYYDPNSGKTVFGYGIDTSTGELEYTVYDNPKDLAAVQVYSHALNGMPDMTMAAEGYSVGGDKAAYFITQNNLAVMQPLFATDGLDIGPASNLVITNDQIAINQAEGSAAVMLTSVQDLARATSEFFDPIFTQNIIQGEVFVNDPATNTPVAVKNPELSYDPTTGEATLLYAPNSNENQAQIDATQYSSLDKIEITDDGKLDTAPAVTAATTETTYEQPFNLRDPSGNPSGVGYAGVTSINYKDVNNNFFNSIILGERLLKPEANTGQTSILEYKDGKFTTIEALLQNQFNTSAQLINGVVQLPLPNGDAVWVDRPIVYFDPTSNKTIFAYSNLNHEDVPGSSELGYVIYDSQTELASVKVYSRSLDAKPDMTATNGGSATSFLSGEEAFFQDSSKAFMQRLYQTTGLDITAPNSLIVNGSSQIAIQNSDDSTPLTPSTQDDIDRATSEFYDAVSDPYAIAGEVLVTDPQTNEAVAIKNPELSYDPITSTAVLMYPHSDQPGDKQVNTAFYASLSDIKIIDDDNNGAVPVVDMRTTFPDEGPVDFDQKDPNDSGTVGYYGDFVTSYGQISSFDFSQRLKAPETNVGQTFSISYQAGKFVTSVVSNQPTPSPTATAPSASPSPSAS